MMELVFLIFVIIETIILQIIPRALSDPFYYIKDIYDKDAFNYHVHGGQQAGIIYPVGGSINWRISKGLRDINGIRPAILDNSDLKFDITYYQVEDHTPM